MLGIRFDDQIYADHSNNGVAMITFRLEAMISLVLQSKALKIVAPWTFPLEIPPLVKWFLSEGSVTILTFGCYLAFYFILGTAA